MGRRTRGRIGDRNLFIVRRFKCLNSLQKIKRREVEATNLAGGEGGIQEMAGGTAIVPVQSLFRVKEIYDEDSR